MGFWPLWKYQEYVERYAQGGDRHTLGSPYSEPLGELGGDTYRQIRLGYFSMPRWIDIFDKSIGEDDISFRRLHFHYLSDRNDYLRDLRRVISTIHQWKTGKLLLKEIAATRAFLRIIPNWVFIAGANAYTTEDGGVNDDRGPYRPIDPIDIHRRARATEPGAPILFNGHLYIDHSGNVVRGVGGGANALIFYSSFWFDARNRAATPGVPPDEVLFHEMVHASRIMRGVINKESVKRYDNLEEFIAIILTNIFRSEKGLTTFSGNHGHDVLQGADAENFLDNPQKLDVPPTVAIQHFKMFQPDYYNDLANLPPPPKYNWVRQYDQSSRKSAAETRKAK